MHEKYWAKISLSASFLKKYQVVIYEDLSIDDSSFISQEISNKKTLTATGARRWAEKSILKLCLASPSNFFIKESDILRRNWND